MKDEIYIDYIKGWIEHHKLFYSNETNKSTKWDVIKSELRRATIAYSKTQKRLKKEQLVALGDNLTKLEAALSSNPTLEIIQNYNQCKLQLEILHEDEANGVFIRSKAKEIKCGEKSEEYFSSIEKQNYKIKHITALEVEGQTITAPDAILNEEKKFYSTLYTSKGTNVDSIEYFLNEIDEHAPKLDLDDQLFMDKDITIIECAKALKALPNGKSPGSDGFTADFQI